jgi:hypothetical protein
MAVARLIAAADRRAVLHKSRRVSGDSIRATRDASPLRFFVPALRRRSRWRWRRCKLHPCGIFDASVERRRSRLSPPSPGARRFYDHFLTHSDPRRHREFDGARSAPTDQGALPRPSQDDARIKLRYLSQTLHPESRYTTINRADISVWHDTRFCKLSLNSRYLSRMQKYMENDENKPAWEKNSRGFWLTVCLLLSAVAGWLMFHLGILH